ncbi:MAG TPA: phosphoesterase PA-phosphatase, partial [Ohtaekwangia sp.]
TSTSAEPVNYTRTFKTFHQAALENGDSRVFAGIHFRFSCDAGVKQGQKIGEWTLGNVLKQRAGV